MTFFKKFFRNPKAHHKKEIIRLFALLGYKLNSYHSLKLKVRNLLGAC